MLQLCVYRVIDALEKFEEHSKSKSCTRRRLEQRDRTFLSCSPNFQTSKASITRYTHAKHRSILFVIKFGYNVIGSKSVLYERKHRAELKLSPHLPKNNWFMLLAVHYRVMERVGSLESTKEALTMFDLFRNFSLAFFR